MKIIQFILSGAFVLYVIRVLLDKPVKKKKPKQKFTTADLLVFIFTFIPMIVIMWFNVFIGLAIGVILYFCFDSLVKKFLKV